MLITRLFAERAIMLEGASTVGSLSRGWQVFRANLSQAFVLGLILWFISVIVGIAIGVIAIALLAPVFLGVFGAAASQTDLNTALPALFGIGTCSTVLIAIIAALIGSVSNAFGSAAWTLAYRSFIAPKLPPQNTLPPATSFT